MSKESPLSITSSDLLVEALQRNLPSDFGTDQTPVVDLRELAKTDGFNLFTSAAMSERFERLFSQDVTSFERGMSILEYYKQSDHFGHRHKAHTVRVEIHGLPIARRALYLPTGNERKSGIYRPSFSVGLLGRHPSRGYISIDVVKYMGPGETVDVYRIEESGNLRVLIGHPGWNDYFQRNMARIFQLDDNSTR